MQNHKTLPIGSGGFTVVPNWAFDALISQGSNAVALGTLLLRLIPGQKGELLLTGSTSRKSLCKVLNWGTENTAKFDQALAAVENTGLIQTRIERGNTKIVSIDGQLHRSDELPEDSQQDSEHQSKAPLSPAKIAPAKNAGPTPAKIAPLAHASTRAEEIKTKNKINKITHHRDAEAAISHDDDDWGNIFSLYAQCFKSIVPRSQKDRFLANANASGLSHQEIKDRLIALSGHPLLATEVTSINVVWHFQHLQKKAKTFDFNVREMLQELARRHVHTTSFKAAISEVLQENQNSHLDPDRFWAYFAQDIEKLLPASPDEGTGKGIENANYSNKEHLPQEMPTLSLKNRECRKEPDGHSNSPFIHLLDDANGDLATSQLISDEPSLSEGIAKESGICSLNHHEHENSEDHLNTSASYAIPFQRTDPEVALRLQANQKLGRTSFLPRADLSMRRTPPSPKSEALNDPMFHLVDGLLKTHTKIELLTKINEAIKRADIEHPLKEILETLKDLTKASNASLSMLKKTVSQRFRLDKAS
jgi:hypothetical protein